MTANMKRRQFIALLGGAAAFRKGLNETGYIGGQNVTLEYHWLEGQYDRLPALLSDLVPIFRSNSRR